MLRESTIGDPSISSLRLEVQMQTSLHVQERAVCVQLLSHSSWSLKADAHHYQRDDEGQCGSAAADSMQRRKARSIQINTMFLHLRVVCCEDYVWFLEWLLVHYYFCYRSVIPSFVLISRSSRRRAVLEYTHWPLQFHPSRLAHQYPP